MSNLTTEELIKSKAQILPKVYFLQFINRNIKRLEINIREIGRKIDDIENAYPLGDCDKFTRMDWEDLQNDLKYYSKQLDIFKRGLYEQLRG